MDEKKKIISLLFSRNEEFKNRLNIAGATVLNTRFYEDSDGDEEMEEIILCLKSRIKDIPMNRSKYYIERVVNKLTASEFQQNFRMNIEAYEVLLKLVTTAYREMYPNPIYISIDKQLLSVIWTLANQEAFRSVGSRFDMAKSTLSWVFTRIIAVLNKLAPTVIKWPNELEAISIADRFNRGTRLKNVIGAIDGTYCPISAPKEQQYAYINRKKFTSITLQAICDSEMKFIDCFAGYPSSVHDARIFRNSPIFERASTDRYKYFGNNWKILADKTYPLLPICIPPYKSTGRRNERQKHFNRIHASMRSVIERAFALFFGRFRRFRRLEMKDFQKIPGTILAGCVLHNICLDLAEDTLSNYISEGLEHAARSSTEYNHQNYEGTAEGHRVRDEMTNEIWDMTHGRID